MAISKNIKSTGPGWERIVAPLIAYCETHGLKIQQIKEKFGTLRFYYNGHSEVENATHMMENLIVAAELESEKTCEWCGAPGKRRKTNWIKTLCDTHEKEWKEGKRWWNEKAKS